MKNYTSCLKQIEEKKIVAYGAGLVVERNACGGGGIDRVDDGLNSVGVDRNAHAEPVQQEGLFTVHSYKS